jgi:hypothetical protein
MGKRRRPLRELLSPEEQREYDRKDKGLDLAILAGYFLGEFFRAVFGKKKKKRKKRPKIEVIPPKPSGGPAPPLLEYRKLD